MLLSILTVASRINIAVDMKLASANIYVHMKHAYHMVSSTLIILIQAHIHTPTLVTHMMHIIMKET